MRAAKNPPTPSKISAVFLLSGSTKRALSSGSTSEQYSSTPTFSAIARAVRSLSPVIITILPIPHSRSALTAPPPLSVMGLQYR